MSTFLAVVTVVVNGVYHLHAIPHEFEARPVCERAVQVMRLPKPKAHTVVFVTCNEILSFGASQLLGQVGGDVPWQLPKPDTSD